MRKILLFILCFLAFQLQAQVTLTTSPYVENFDNIGTVAPAGFFLSTNGTATSLGNTLIAAPAYDTKSNWSQTSGGFKNFASWFSGGANTSTNDQALRTDRALGFRQTGTATTGGDFGASFIFQIANTVGKTNLNLSFDLQSLDNSSTVLRTTTWKVQYGFGSSPTAFTDIATSPAVLTTSGTFESNNISVNFGNLLDNKSNVITIRIVTLVATTGSSSRPTSAIDNFSISFIGGTAGTPALSTNVASLDFGSQLTTGVYSEKTYKLNYSNLTAAGVDVSVTGPFTISKSAGGNYATSLNYIQSELTGSNTAIFVKFNPTASGNFSGSISHVGGGASNVNVDLTGVGLTAALSVTPTVLNFGNQDVNVGSVSKTFQLSATTPTKSTTIAVAFPFALSKDNVVFSNSLNYTSAELASAKTVYVQFKPTTETVYNAIISITNPDADAKSVAVSGTGTVPITPAFNVLISEIYTDGNTTQSAYKNNYIELYNAGTNKVDLTGWSIQYAAGTSNASWTSKPLVGVIPPKSFYLIKESTGTMGMQDLPIADLTTNFGINNLGGKVLLSKSLSIVTGNNPSGSEVADFVGYGNASGFKVQAATVATSPINSIERKAKPSSTSITMGIGGTDEFEGNAYNSNNNYADFVITTANPQNSIKKEPVGTNHVVISQVYGGGGNSGALYKNDFIELYNPTDEEVNLNGWSVQYGAATNTTWAATPLVGSIAPKGYYLIQEAAGAGGTADLPTPDVIGTINLSGTAGKVLLTKQTAAHTGARPMDVNIVDFVGFGSNANGFEGTAPTPAPSNTNSIKRKSSAITTTNTWGQNGSEQFEGNGWDTDNNAADFLAVLPIPQNAAVKKPMPPNGVFLTPSVNVIAFGNQIINTVSNVKSYTLNTGGLTNPLTVSVGDSYKISKDNINFTNILGFEISEVNPVIYVKFNPTTGGSKNSNIQHASAVAGITNLKITGYGLDPSLLAFDFEDCSESGSSNLSNGFYQYSVSGAQTWGCVTGFGRNNADATGTASLGNAIQINGYANGNNVNEDWLISPPLLLSQMPYAILSFWTRSAFAGDKLQLKVSTNYTGSGDPALATWTAIDGKFPEPNSNVWTKSDHIDLTSFKNAPFVYVAIVYNSSTSGASRWTFDDFAVRSSITPPEVDIATSTSLINFGFQTANTISDAKPFTFSAGNLIGDVKVIAPANYLLSENSSGNYTSILTLGQTAVNNTSPTIFIKFNPTATNKNYNSNLRIESSGSNGKSVSLSGNSFDVNATLEVVNWNIEWFGSTENGPSNKPQQAANVRTIVNNLNADVYGFAEVVDTTLFRNVVLPAGYNVIFSDFGSYADTKNSVDYALTQKLAFMYRTDIIRPLNTFGIFRDAYLANPSNNGSGTPFKNWSSGRFPYLMEAEINSNGKLDTVYFIEIHAKANTGTLPAQIESYERRRDGNIQLKEWLDQNLSGKKVLILGDFNDVLDLDKTIAPLPPGTATSYINFMTDTENYFPITLPLSQAGKQSTTGFPTVIDNVIISKDLNKNYISGTAEVMDLRSLVTNYATTTTDHYPIKSRYLFSNSAPTIDAVNDVVVCYTETEQRIKLTGITAGQERNQNITVSVKTDNPTLFSNLKIVEQGTDNYISYQLKDSKILSTKITITVKDDGGSDFGGLDTVSTTFNLNVNAKAIAVIKGNAEVFLNGTLPLITFSTNIHKPTVYTYQINNGPNLTLTSANGDPVTVAVPTHTTGTFIYTLISVQSSECIQNQSGSATIIVKDLPIQEVGDARIEGTKTICINTTAPLITFTAIGGAAPYTFTYSINGAASKTINSNSASTTITASTEIAGVYVYKLIKIANANGSKDLNTTATITVLALPDFEITSEKGFTVSKGDEIQLAASGGVQYTWVGSNMLSGQNTNKLTFRAIESGIYKVKVVNSNGCSIDKSVQITVLDDYKLESGTVMTPNGDGINDTFIIKNIDLYPNNTLKVFDKSGRIVYTKKSYNNDWNGMFNGNPLPEGTYYYILEVGTGIGSIKGFINIVKD